MKNHVVVLAIICFFATVMWALAGLTALGALTVGAFFVDDPVGSAFMVVGGVFAGGGLLFLSLLHGVAGFGLLRDRNWARWIVIILAALQLFNPPLGTVIGIYGLWVLFHAETQAVFEGS